MAKARGFWVSINSNLTLYDRHPERLAGADLVYTSLDGDAAAHEAARGEGSYAGVLTAIADLVRGGKPVIAICVVTEHSLGQTDAVLRQAERLGFRVHFQPQCTDTDIVRGSIPASVTNEEFRAFWRAPARRKAPRPSGRELDRVPRVPGRSGRTSRSRRTPRRARGAPPGTASSTSTRWDAGIPAPTPKARRHPSISSPTTGGRRGIARRRAAVASSGPMLEFNLLFQRPFAAHAADGLRAYGLAPAGRRPAGPLGRAAGADLLPHRPAVRGTAPCFYQFLDALPVGVRAARELARHPRRVRGEPRGAARLQVVDVFNPTGPKVLRAGARSN